VEVYVLEQCSATFGPPKKIDGFASSHYFDTRIKSSSVVNVITCSDTVAMSALPSCYKNDTDH
jgi:hypothetical protein